MPVILILDDQETNCRIFSKLAATVGEDVKTRTFTDALHALHWIDGNTVDLVIADYKMPGIDGGEFTRRLRALPDYEDVPVIVITSYSDRNFRIDALRAGATDFVLSPVDHCEFTTRVRNLLELRRHQRLLQGRARNLAEALERSEESRDRLLRDSREALAQVIDTVPAMISAVDVDGNCIFANAAFAAMAGAAVPDLLGTDAAARFGDSYARHSRKLDDIVRHSGHPFQDIEDEIADCDGTRRILLATKSPLRDAAGQLFGVLTTTIDVTDQKLAETHLRQLAHTDPLTKLPNRYVLRKKLRIELARSRRCSRNFALHFMDLDRFKLVNDAYGHQVGDQLLAMVATRLSEAMSGDETVARLGGDEFAILQPTVEKLEDAADCAGRLLGALAAPFDCKGHVFTVRASIGTTLYPHDGNDPDEILRRADLAMYRAKAEAPGTFRLFEAGMDVRARAAVSMEADLRAAIDRDEFVLHFQPQIDLRTNRVSGVEALLRWQRPGLGLVAPGQFLPLAEETGLIVRINEWVLRTACSQAAEWRRRLTVPLRVSVNLSPTQFVSHDVKQVVIAALAESGLPPGLLELELTEGILFANTAAETLHEIHELGVQLSVDDFGTGYSSLCYLKRFPIDRLKIDQSFIRNLDTDVNDAAIVRAVINLGRSLNIRVTAEGVETAEQMRHLRLAGCDEIQGFFFSPALPAEACEQLIGRSEPAFADFEPAK